MIDVHVLLYMALAFVLGLWLYDHRSLNLRIGEMLKLSSDVNKNSSDIATAIQKVHNEQAKSLIALAEKVEVIRNKYEFAAVAKRNQFIENEPKK